MKGRPADPLLGSKDTFDPFTEEGWQVLRLAFEKRAPDPSGWLLDVGCGTGSSRRVYANRGQVLIGLDNSWAMVRLARERIPEGLWLQGDAVGLPIDDSSLDVVAFSSVLHHLPDPQLALAEARRVLKPGGLVFAFDPNALHPPFAIFRNPKSPFYLSEGVSPDERPMRPRILRDLFQRSNLTHISQTCTSGISYRAVAPSGFNRLLPIYNRLDAALQASGLARWLGSFVITSGYEPGP